MRADVLTYAVTGHSGPFVTVADWPTGVWLNEPEWRTDGDDVLMTAARGSDFWRYTGRGVSHDSGHAYLAPFEVGTAVEVDLTVNVRALLDQAGILVRQSRRHWVTAGVARVDGEPRLSIVHTDRFSDWSSHSGGDWQDERVTLRISRSDDSLTVRARREPDPWRLVRLLPIPATAMLLAGPYVSAPSRSGYTVRFHRFVMTAADPSPRWRQPSLS